MTYDEFEKEIKKKSVTAFDLHRKLHFEITPLKRPETGLNELNEFVLVQLLSALFSTGESILILMTHAATVEANALLRSVFEGSMKYVYMMKDNLYEESQLVHEYYVEMPEIQKIKEHELAVESKIVFDEWGIENHPFEVSILNPSELDALENKYSRNYRSNLSKKWSYKRILEKIIEQDSNYQGMLPTLYEYDLSSHLMHYDGHCLKSRIEDVMATEFSLQHAYGLKIISNVLQLQVIRTSEYLRVHQWDKPSVIEIIKEIFDFVNELAAESTSITNKWRDDSCEK